MSKIDWLNEEIIKEYKAGNEKRRVFLQTLKAAILQKQKDKGELTEDDESQILKVELKQRQQARSEYESAGREDMLSKIDFEITTLKEMLPPEMSETEIEEIVVKVIGEQEDKSFGNIMKQSMIALKGQADGSVVSQLVKKNLG